MNKLLQERREAAGLTRTELAGMLGVALSTVSRIESGERQVTPKYLALCRRVMGWELAPTRLVRGEPRSETQWLRDAFPREVRLAGQPLRMAFRAARQNALGEAMVERLDAGRRPAAEWRALRHLAPQLNGDEQMFLLHALLAGGVIQAVTPSEVGCPLCYVTPPRHWWLALIVGPCVFFPQLTVTLPYNWTTRSIRSPRLDFLVAIPSDPKLFLAAEVDGVSHRGRTAEDAARDLALEVPTLRIASHRLQSEDFWTTFEAEWRGAVEAAKAKWPRFTRKR